jgi:phosphatidylglycerophosphatase A
MRTLPRTIWINPLHFIACGLGFGALPWMPGTWTTLAAIPLVFALHLLPLWGYLSITLALILLGIYVCGVTNLDFGTQDHPACSWDEMASFPLVMAGVPLTWYYLALGFMLFRLFDIWKPWPIRWVDQHIHGGLGVMLDDVLAALCSLIILQALMRCL